MTELRVALLPGDGIGKEVVPVGAALLEKIRERRGLDLELCPVDLGADRFLRDGSTFPEEERRFIRDECDAVLLGAIGDPRVPSLDYARDILFGLRFGLDLYCNVRPIVCLADALMPLKGKDASSCDIVVFRENTEGVYVNVGGNFKKGSPDEVAINEDLNTRKGVERVIRAAFAYARAHGRGRVHMSDKSNAMAYAHGLWRRTFAEVAKEYPEIEAKHVYVDALCLGLVRSPESYDVIVTNNLFGDIVTDLGAALQGGLGMAASANVRPDDGRWSDVTARCRGLFEPVHGSAPDIAGKDLANPLATVLTVGMMLTHLGVEGEEERLTRLVEEAVAEGVTTPDLGGDKRTSEVARFILDRA